MMARMICLVIGYLCGLLQTGFIYGELHGMDIRKYGSGNSGTTNALPVSYTHLDVYKRQSLNQL